MIEPGLYLKDCVEGMHTIDDGSVDLTVTSPPYDNLRTYNDSSTWNDDVFKAVSNELYRVTKDGGVVVWIVADSAKEGNESGTSFRQALYFKEIGFKLLDTMIWFKECFSFPSSDHYPQTFEYMFVFTKGKINTFNPIKDRKNLNAGRKIHPTYRQKDGSILKPDLSHRTNLITQEYGIRYNVWQQPSEKHNITGHPAVFPLDLARDHIRSWSNPGDLILDPFTGSGTTAIACSSLDRKFIGFEIDPAYYNAAKYRISEATKQMKLF